MKQATLNANAIHSNNQESSRKDLGSGFRTGDCFVLIFLDVGKSLVLRSSSLSGVISIMVGLQKKAERLLGDCGDVLGVSVHPACLRYSRGYSG